MCFCPSHVKFNTANQDFPLISHCVTEMNNKYHLSSFRNYPVCERDEWAFFREGTALRLFVWPVAVREATECMFTSNAFQAYKWFYGFIKTLFINLPSKQHANPGKLNRLHFTHYPFIQEDNFIMKYYIIILQLQIITLHTVHTLYIISTNWLKNHSIQVRKLDWVTIKSVPFKPINIAFYSTFWVFNPPHKIKVSKLMIPFSLKSKLKM